MMLVITIIAMILIAIFFAFILFIASVLFDAIPALRRASKCVAKSIKRTTRAIKRKLKCSKD